MFPFSSKMLFAMQNCFYSVILRHFGFCVQLQVKFKNWTWTHSLLRFLWNLHQKKLATVWELCDKYLQIETTCMKVLISWPKEQVLNIFTSFMWSTHTMFLFYFPSSYRELSTESEPPEGADPHSTRLVFRSLRPSPLYHEARSSLPPILYQRITNAHKSRETKAGEANQSEPHIATKHTAFLLRYLLDNRYQVSDWPNQLQQAL